MMKDRALSLDIPVPPKSLLNGITNHIDTDLGNDIVCWLLDTRKLWPGTNIQSAPGAAFPMSLITTEEQQGIKQKMFIADAKMSLGSALLKRLFISKSLGIPWKQIRLARRGDPKHGKPCAADSQGRPIEGIDFNVSHQNGLVTLIGWNGTRSYKYDPIPKSASILSPSRTDPEVTVGMDIVSVDERKAASSTIDSEGFAGWVDVYDSVFSAKERDDMKFDVDFVTLPNGTRVSGAELGMSRRSIARRQNLSVTTSSGAPVSFSSELLLDAKLRRFYAYFCYKEAYIKLSGEALLAPWLRELEFFNVRSPRANPDPGADEQGPWGEQVDDVEVKLRGRAVDNVKMKIQAFEDVFMIASAIQGDVKALDIPGIQNLNLEKDVLEHATSNLSARSPELVMTPWEARYF